jgi:hypothetical protein
MIKKNLRAKLEHTFWITNISRRDVLLADLSLKIPAGSSMNLLDDRHFDYNIDQLQKSAQQGSIHTKRDKIKVCDNPPEIPVHPGIYLSKEPRYVPPRSSIKIEEKVYDELPNLDQLVSEEKFADEFTAEDGFTAPITKKK